jgi:hypothetical protein
MYQRVQDKVFHYQSREGWLDDNISKWAGIAERRRLCLPDINDHGSQLQSVTFAYVKLKLWLTSRKFKSPGSRTCVETWRSAYFKAQATVAWIPLYVTETLTAVTESLNKRIDSSYSGTLRMALNVGHWAAEDVGPIRKSLVNYLGWAPWSIPEECVLHSLDISRGMRTRWLTNLDPLFWEPSHWYRGRGRSHFLTPYRRTEDS